MTENVDDLTAKVANLNAELDCKEWCDMPPELKRKCIHSLDFKTRISLRSLSRTDRDVVDSQRMPCSMFYIGRRNIEIDVMDDTLKLNICGENWEKRRTFIGYILNNVQIESLSLYFSQEELFDENKLNDLERILDINSILTKKFFGSSDTRLSITLLRKCQPKIESMVLKSLEEDLSSDFFHLEQVVRAKHISIENAISGMRVVPLIEKWIQLDSKIGTALKFKTKSRMINELDSYFGNRRISRDQWDLRISTNNKDKHIYISDGGFGASCEVIQAELQNTSLTPIHYF